jgi:prolyl oligopeptidase
MLMTLTSGDPDTDDWDDFLHKYSPYHNLEAETTYPPLLVTTSTRDDRVHPGHARKLVAR